MPSVKCLYSHPLCIHLNAISAFSDALAHSDAMDTLIQNSGTNFSNYQQVQLALTRVRIRSALDVDGSVSSEWSAVLSLSQRLLGEAHPLRIMVEQESGAVLGNV